MATEGPTPPGQNEPLILYERRWPDGHIDVFHLTPEQYEKLIGTSPETVIPQPPEPPPPTGPGITQTIPPVPPQNWLEPTPSPPQRTTNGKQNNHTPQPSPEEEAAAATLINWKAVRALFGRRRATEAQISERKARKRALQGAAAGAALVGTFWGGSYFLGEQATAANPQQTIATGQCIDAVPAGSIITARSYTLDGGSEITDGPNTVSILEFTQEGKFCATSQTAHIQSTGNPDLEQMDQIVTDYESQYRRDGFSIFIVQTH